MTQEEAARLLQAYVDGELDPAKSLELEAHLGGNPAARAACERLRQMSAAIRDKADYYAAPAAFAARLRKAVPAEPAEAPRTPVWLELLRSAGAVSPQRWLRPAAALSTVALVAFGAGALVMQPGEDERLASEVLASHVRATLADRLHDVASSDQHTVKPWLSARLDYSPPVADLAAQGFELVGGRVDYVGARTVAVLVYKRRQHVIDVFVWPAVAGAAERAFARDGFNFERFARNGGMSYWIVSDLGRNELNDLARLLAEHDEGP
jgi:anti-sigma factor RsiW